MFVYEFPLETQFFVYNRNGVARANTTTPLDEY